MAAITITLDDDLFVHADARARVGGYSNVAEYVVDLIAGDAREHEVVLAALAEGEASGVSARSPEQILEDLLRGRLAA